MHFLHEFHRQQLHAKDHELRAKDLEHEAREHRISATVMERRAREAEERVKRMDRGAGGGANGNEEKEREVWRLMGGARKDLDGGEDGVGAVKEMEKNRYQ